MDLPQAHPGVTGGAERWSHGHGSLEPGGSLGICTPILSRRRPCEHDVDGLAALGKALDDPALDRAGGIAPTLAPTSPEPLIEDAELELGIVGLDEEPEFTDRRIVLPHCREETGHDQPHFRIHGHRVRQQILVSSVGHQGASTVPGTIESLGSQKREIGIQAAHVEQCGRGPCTAGAARMDGQ